MTFYEVQMFLIALKALTDTEFIFTLREDGSGAVEIPSPDPGRKLPFSTFADTGELQDYLNEALNSAVQNAVDNFGGVV